MAAPISEAWFDELAEFLRIPSISADPAHAADVVRAAEWVCAFIRDAGGECEVVDWHGQPLAIGEIRASAGGEAPTVLCYGHFDVQPPDPLELWDSPPFEPEIRDELPLRPRHRRRQGPAVHAAQRRARARAGRRAARQRPLLLRRRRGDRRPLDRRVPRSRRARRRRGDHLRQRHDPARRARVQPRDARHGVLPRHAAHGRARPALGHVRRCRAQRRACA